MPAVEDIVISDNDIYQAVVNGMTYREAAARLGVKSTTTVLYRMRKAGIIAARRNIVVPTVAIPRSVAVRAYIAGIIDGEGCISRTNSRRGEGPTFWRVTVSMTYKPVIDWLGSFGGKVYPNSVGRPANLKPQYAWIVGRHSCVLVLLAAVRPYLTVKAELADRVIKEIKVRLRAAKNRNL